MTTLVSPGVSVTVTDESFFVPASAPTLPLIFVATADEKKQPNGITPAAGTYESNVVRLVTSLQQSTQMYGVPKFLVDFAGKPLHGDARNEQGLLALNKYLGIGASAYVVRANIDLNDDITDIQTKWVSKIQTASYVLSNYVNSFLDEYNTAHGFVATNAGYRTTVTRTELEQLAEKATEDIFALYTFKNAKFDFYDSNLLPATSTKGYQVVSFGGSITAGTNTTGLGAQVYTATVLVDGVSKSISIAGTSAATFASLVTEIQNDLGAVALVEIVNGNLKITSNTIGTSSTIVINDGNLFKALTGYVSLLLPIAGDLADAPLPVYANGYSQAATGEYFGFDGMAEQWETDGLGTVVGHEAEWSADEAAEMLVDAAADYQYTVEFLNKTSLGANDAARRVSIVTALKAVISSNQEIRSENFEYNLILAPGFPEVVSDMINLSTEIGEEAFVIADVPPTLAPEAAAAWGTTSDRVKSTNVAYYYPGGLTTNIDGAEVYGAASGVALYTYTYSDNATNAVHFAPAGPRRGQVVGYQMGYLTGTLGLPTTFVATNLNVGQRNALYQYFNNINPITEIPGRGVLVMGQKTSAIAASAMDRVNVVRMIADLRRKLRKVAFSYLFEPNDQITRDNLKAAADGELSDLMTKRGLYDFLSVCDSSNNSDTAIDRNELYLDIAIKPVKAVEFIYIPIRVLSTGASLTGN